MHMHTYAYIYQTLKNYKLKLYHKYHECINNKTTYTILYKLNSRAP